jgi:hypothetical protein
VSESPQPLALSAAQREIWLGEHVNPGAPYRVGQYIDISGPVDRTLLEAAVRRTVDEAESVRVRYVDGPVGPQQIVEPVPDWELPVVDVSREPDPVAAAEERMRAALFDAIALNPGRLFSCKLFAVNPRRHLLFHGYHQIAMDAVGVFLMANRMAEVYTCLAGGRSVGGSPFRSLRELVASDTDYRASARFMQDQTYWGERLRGYAVPARPAGVPPQAPGGTARQTVYLPADAVTELKGASGQARQLAAAVVAAVALDLSARQGVEDVVVGFAVTGRTDAVLRRIPGMVSNLVPVRLSVRPGTGRAELLRQAAERIFEALKHGRYRGEDIVRYVGIPGDVKTLIGPLVNVFPFRYDLRFGGNAAVPRNLTPGNSDDMTIAVYDRADGRSLRIDLAASGGSCVAGQLAARGEALVRELQSLRAARNAHA